MDVVQAYARWFRRRCVVLLAATAAAALLAIHLAGIEDLRESARLPLLATAGGIALFLLSVAGLAFVCHRLHRTRPRGEARAVRRLLEPAERLVAPAVLLLLPLALAPAAFRRPPPPPTEIVFAPSRPFRRTPPPPLPLPAPEPSPVDVARAEPPPPPDDPPPPATPATRAWDVGPDDNDVFRLLHEDLAMPEPRIVFDRLGVPDEERALEGRPLSVELEALVLWEDDGPTGSAVEIRIDLPIEHGPVLRLSTLSLADGEPDLALAHGTLDVVVRLWGGTRRAAMDLRVSVGLAVDELEAEGIDGGPRLSPRLGLELAFWQTERAGLELKVGQTIPVSATGGAMAMTDAVVALRIDLSESVSLRAGWRYFVIHARDYDGSFAAGGVVAELDRDFSGPFVGLELRF